MIIIYFLQAWRNICRNKVQSMLTLLGLAVALFCFTFFAHLVYGNLIEDTELQDADRIVRLVERGSYDNEYVKPVPELLQLLNEVEEVESYGRYYFEGGDWRYCTLSNSESGCYDAIINANIVRVDSGAVELLSMKPLAGSLQDAIGYDNSIILLKQTAIAMYGSVEQAIGKSMHSYGLDCVVRTVIEPLPYNCSLRQVPQRSGFIVNLVGDFSNDYYSHFWVKCKKGYTKQQLADRIERAHIVYPRYDGEGEVQVVVDDYRAWTWEKIWRVIYLFMLITLPGSLILLAALSNFFHLLVSDVLARQREFVLRRVHGAKTLDLWCMVGSYVTLMLLLVGILSLIIIEVFFPLFDLSAEDGKMAMSMPDMMRQNAWALLALVLIGLFIAWVAVVRVRRRTLQESIKSSSGRRPGRHIWRNILLGYQLTLALVFLFLLGAVLMQDRTDRAVIAPQFTAAEKEDLLVLRAAHQNILGTDLDFTRQYTDLIAQYPDIVEYHIIHNQLAGRNQQFSSKWFLRENDDLDTLMMQTAYLSADDFRFLSYQLTEGHFAETPDEVVVDAEFLRAHQLKIGDKIRVEKQRKREVPLDVENPERLSPYELYVIQNFDYEQYTYTITGYLEEGPAVNMQANMSRYNHTLWVNRGCVFFNDGNNGSELWMRCSPGKGREVARLLNEHFREVASPHEVYEYGSDIPYQEMSYDQVISLSDYVDEKNSDNVGSMVGYFWLLSVIAIALTLLGIYSAISVDTKFRRKEMAVRKINGAKTWQIALIFLRLYLIEMTVAVILSVSVAQYLIALGGRNLRVIFSHGPLFYGTIILVMTIIVAFTIGVQIWRIARVQPAEIIKSE